MIKGNALLLIGGVLLGLCSSPAAGQMLVALSDQPVQLTGPLVSMPTRLRIPADVKTSYPPAPLRHQGRLATTGKLVESDSPLHMAIEGNGFFRVQLTDGSFAFTRDGSFHRNAEGTIVNGDGLAVDPNILVPTTADNITIAPTGEVGCIEDGVKCLIGTIQLYRFANRKALRPLGNHLYAPTDASGAEWIGTPGQDGFGNIRQNALEDCDVAQIADEMGSPNDSPSGKETLHPPPNRKVTP